MGGEGKEVVLPLLGQGSLDGQARPLRVLDDQVLSGGPEGLDLDMVFLPAGHRPEVRASFNVQGGLGILLKPVDFGVASLGLLPEPEVQVHLERLHLMVGNIQAGYVQGIESELGIGAEERVAAPGELEVTGVSGNKRMESSWGECPSPMST